MIEEEKLNLNKGFVFAEPLFNLVLSVFYVIILWRYMRTIEYDKEEKMAIVVNKERCPQNHPCPVVHVCPTDVISQAGFDAPTVDEENCIDCGKCIHYCVMGVFQKGE